MPKQLANAMLEWPYVEGLRIDEAMHPQQYWPLACMDKVCQSKMVRT